MFRHGHERTSVTSSSVPTLIQTKFKLVVSVYNLDISIYNGWTVFP